MRPFLTLSARGNIKGNKAVPLQIMAGTSQHYLAQFLQKGFTIKSSGRTRFTWWYRKDKPAIEERIKYIGVEDHFYGDSATEASADDAITEIESPFAVLIDRLRESASRVEPIEPRIPFLIAHFVVRTKALREVALNGASNLLHSFRDLFPDQECLRSVFLDATHIDRIIEEHIRPDWRSLTRVDREKGRALYRSLMNKRVPEFWPVWQEQLSTGVGLVITQLRSAVRERLNKRLAETPAPDKVAERYKNYVWTVQSCENLILGDTACVIEREDGSFRGIDDTDHPARNIFLPICSNLALIGSAGPIPLVQSSRLNEASAKSSWEFFIASERNSAIDMLHNQIGEWAEFISKDQAEEIVRPVLLEVLLGSS